MTTTFEYFVNPTPLTAGPPRRRPGRPAREAPNDLDRHVLARRAAGRAYDEIAREWNLQHPDGAVTAAYCRQIHSRASRGRGA